MSIHTEWYEQDKTKKPNKLAVISLILLLGVIMTYLYKFAILSSHAVYNWGISGFVTFLISVYNFWPLWNIFFLMLIPASFLVLEVSSLFFSSRYKKIRKRLILEFVVFKESYYRRKNYIKFRNEVKSGMYDDAGFYTEVKSLFKNAHRK